MHKVAIFFNEKSGMFSVKYLTNAVPFSVWVKNRRNNGEGVSEFDCEFCDLRSTTPGCLEGFGKSFRVQGRGARREVFGQIRLHCHRSR